MKINSFFFLKHHKSKHTQVAYLPIPCFQSNGILTVMYYTAIRQCFSTSRMTQSTLKQSSNQLLQLCTASTAWSESDQAVRAMHRCNSWWLGPLWSDSVIKLVSVLFGKCTTLVATKCWPMETRLPCGDHWKAENLGVFRRWPITRCFIKSDRAVLFIEHSINFRLNGEHWRAVQFKVQLWTGFFPSKTIPKI